MGEGMNVRPGEQLCLPFEERCGTDGTEGKTEDVQEELMDPAPARDRLTLALEQLRCAMSEVLALME